MSRRFSVDQRVSGQRPCPVCGRADWCAFTSDGRFVLCHRLDGWNGTPAIRQTNAGWLHALTEREQRTAIPASASAPALRPSLGRPQLDCIYRRLAELCGLDEHARQDLIEKRRFPQALEGAAVAFSLPASGMQNQTVSEALVAEFGLAVIERVPGFAIACNRCDGAGVKNQQPCDACEGLGKTRPRFRSVRGGQHDYAVIACDEDGLAFWGMSRRLPFEPSKGKASKYLLLSSSRAMEASIAGLAKYHVAGRNYPPRELWITEGIIKAEITAWHRQCRVVGLAGTQPDEATVDALLALARRWAA